MPDKTQFTFLIRGDERATLLRLSRLYERSAGATLRWLIRQAERELPTDAPAQTLRQSDTMPVEVKNDAA